MTSPGEYLSNPIHWGLRGGPTLFYGACGMDYGPLDLFLSPHQHLDQMTAIYVDNALPIDELRRFIKAIARRYASASHNIRETQLSPESLGLKHADFFPKLNDAQYPEGYAQFFEEFEKDFFGYRFHFQDIGLTLIYLKTEVIQTFRIFQKKLKIYPDLLVLHEHNWFNFPFAGDSLMYRSARVKPRFIYVADNTQPWPGYTKVSEPFIDEGQQHPVPRTLYLENTHYKKLYG